MEIDPSKTKTACTNGISITFNPYFIEPITDLELLGLMMHELGHVIYQHIELCRKHKLTHKLHNIAGDHYINLWLLNMHYELPGDNYYADRKYLKWSTMKIYQDLKKDPPADIDAFECDIVAPPEGMDEKEHRETVTANLIKAVTQARLSNDHGSIPGNLLKELEEVMNPRLPWNVILQNCMTDYSNDDYSWGRPNRRYLPDFYLPSRHSEGIKQLTIGSDVSGSMNQPLLNEIFSEVEYIWDMLKPDRMRIMTFDTKVHMNTIIEEGDMLKEIKLVGGGGTIVEPLLETIKKENPLFALIFTDGFFSMPDMSGIYSDIFWIIRGNTKFKCPIGTVIFM